MSPLRWATMSTIKRLTVIIEKEGGGYVARCPELDIASQGNAIEEARANLEEAVSLFLEHAGKSEISERLHTEICVTPIEVTVG